jgi:hypothetical protein
MKHTILGRILRGMLWNTILSNVEPPLTQFGCMSGGIPIDFLNYQTTCEVLHNVDRGRVRSNDLRPHRHDPYTTEPCDAQPAANSWLLDLGVVLWSGNG